MAFQFGAGNQATTQPSSTGFTLSQPQQQQTKPFNFVAPASTGAFNFGSSTTANTGFTFGAPATTSAGPGLSFGTPASTAATPGFSFGAPAAAPSGGFSFGQTATTTASATGFGFGQQGSTTTTTATTTAAPGFMFGTPGTSVGGGSTGFNFGGGGGAGGGAPAAAATTAAASVFSFTPTSTFSGFGTPATTTGSTTMFGFGMGGGASSATTATGGFALVSAQPSSTSSAFTFGTPKTTAPVIAPAFGFGTAITAAPTTTAASNTTGTLPFGTPAFGGTGFAFSGTKPTVTTSATGFTFGTTATTAGASIFAPSQMTSAPILNPPGPFNQGTTTTATMGNTAATSALGTSLVSTGGSGGFALNAPASSFGTTTQPASGTTVNFMTTETPKSAAFAFPLSTPVISSSGTTGFAAAALTTSATVIKPTLNFTAPPTTTITPASTSMPTPSQADQAKVPSLTTSAAPTTVSSSVSSGFGFSSSTTSVTTSSAGFPTLGSSLKIATTTSGPSLLSTTSPFATPAGSFGSFGTTTSVSLSTATTVTASSAAGAALTTTTTVTPASAAPPATMNFRQLEDTINKWKIELEEQERVFLNQATQVNAWDRLLISNGEKITELNEAVERVKLDQQRLDHELDFILAQQRELEELLMPLEKSVEATPNIHHQQHADLEREHTYHLAENIDAQLKRMAEDIKEIIEHLNSSNKTQDDNDPIQQIAKILNAHMDALQWVDQNTAVLRRKLDETSKLYESHRRDHEKSFRVGFN